MDERRQGFRSVIEKFLRGRLEEKQKSIDEADTMKREELESGFAPDNWLADAAHRVGQIQAVTHVLKATHPFAKGSSLCCGVESLRQQSGVGSHALPKNFTLDVVGNAAALDVYKFLRLEYDGKTLLDWMRENDADLLAALHPDAVLAEKWRTAFTGLIRSPSDAVSHTHAKQVYWLAGDDPLHDGHYHLLSPLYASSLAHELFRRINDDRFSEEAKEARQAKKDGKPHAREVHEYSNLAQQNFGGSKPQNVSQLNSERGGVNYLLASLPPIWKSRDIKPPLGAKNLFEQIGRRREMAEVVNELRKFLESDPPANIETRNRRDRLLEQIFGELQQYAGELHSLAPGWSSDPRCRLTQEEICWLDPERAALDPELADIWRQGGWKGEVCRRFANWLNHALGKRLPLGDIEHAFWEDAFAEELRNLEGKENING